MLHITTTHQSIPYIWSAPPLAAAEKPSSAGPPRAWPSSYFRNEQKCQHRCRLHTDRDIELVVCGLNNNLINLLLISL